MKSAPSLQKFILTAFAVVGWVSPTFTQTAALQAALSRNSPVVDNISKLESPPFRLFQPARYLADGQLTWDTALADMNNDGKLDVVAISYSGAETTGDGTVAVLLGKGNGSFAAAKTQDSGGWFTVSMSVADVNGDGKLDVAVTSSCNSGCTTDQSVVAVFLGNGNGSLQPPTIYATGGRTASSGEGSALPILVADLNHDGKPDLVIVNQTTSSFNDGTIGVLIGNGDGTFQPVVAYDAGGGYSGGFALADLDRDGNLDLVVANCSSGTILCPSDNATVGVLRGNSDGTFQAVQILDRGGAGFFSAPVVVTDVNGDGKPDLLVGNYCTNGCNTNASLSVLLGRGDGTFDAPVSYKVDGWSVIAIGVQDLNGDGRPDLLVADGNAAALLGNGDGSFQAAQNYSSGGNSSAVASVDVNGDGIADMVVTNGTGNTVAILPGNGDGTFRNEITYPTGGAAYVSPARIGDLNRDGRQDLVFGNWCVNSSICSVGESEQGTVGVLMNRLK